MELSAVIEALRVINSSERYAGSPVTVYSDSQYVVKAFTDNWLQNWQRRGWTNAKGEPVANRELWEQLLRQIKQHRHTFVWVRGHAGNPMNERCDRLAVAQSKIAPHQTAYWSSAGNPLSEVQEQPASSPTPEADAVSLPTSELALERNEIAVNALWTALLAIKTGDPQTATEPIEKALRHLASQAEILRGQPQDNGAQGPQQPQQLDMWDVDDLPF